MKTLLTALALTVAGIGVAAAQQSPALIGDYSSNVLRDFNGQQATGDAVVSGTAAASPRAMEDDRPRPRLDGYSPNVTENDLRSGK